jgi:hypothetical protein
VTTLQTKAWFSCLFLIIFMISAGQAFSATGTIVTKTDERFENVVYTIDNIYKVLKFEVSGAKKNISFTDVKAVYDPQGKEITTEVLGGYSTPLKEGWKSEDTKEYREGKKKLYDFGIRLAGNYTFPAGSYFEGLSAGIGFEGDIIIPVSREISIRATLSRTGIKNTGEIVSSNVTFNGTRILASAQFNQPNNRNELNKGLWYAYSGIGVFTSTASLGVHSASETKLLLEGGGGVVAFLSDGFGIDLGGSIGMIPVGSSPGYGVQYAFLFDVKIGLTYWVFSK